MSSFLVSFSLASTVFSFVRSKRRADIAGLYLVPIVSSPSGSLSTRGDGGSMFETFVSRASVFFLVLFVAPLSSPPETDQWALYRCVSDFPMAYLYSKKFQTPITPLILELRSVRSLSLASLSLPLSLSLSNFPILSRRNSTWNPTTKFPSTPSPPPSPPSISTTLTTLSSPSFPTPSEPSNGSSLGSFPSSGPWRPRGCTRWLGWRMRTRIARRLDL